MKNKMFEYMDSLFQNFSPLKLKILNPILRQVIPFNSPHKIGLVHVDDTKVVAQLPNKRVNHNHLGGAHACAIATLGEFCAGMALTKRFPIIKYRPILKNLNIDYLYQGKSLLKGETVINEHEIERVSLELAGQSKSLIEMQTSIYDKDKNLVAKVESVWQIKSWKAVKTKLT